MMRRGRGEGLGREQRQREQTRESMKGRRKKTINRHETEAKFYESNIGVCIRKRQLLEIWLPSRNACTWWPSGHAKR